MFVVDNINVEADGEVGGDIRILMSKLNDIYARVVIVKELKMMEDQSILHIWCIYIF